MKLFLALRKKQNRVHKYFRINSTSKQQKSHWMARKLMSDGRMTPDFIWHNFMEF